MNKVKPQVGQKWQERNKFENRETVHHVDRFGCVYWNNSGDDWSAKEQMINWKFVPQTDLEWLAVNVSKFLMSNNCLAVCKGAPSGVMYTIQPPSGRRFTRRQWQSMRYKLGLDKKPNISSKAWASKLKEGSLK